MQTESRSRS